MSGGLALFPAAELGLERLQRCGTDTLRRCSRELPNTLNMAASNLARTASNPNLLDSVRTIGPEELAQRLAGMQKQPIMLDCRSFIDYNLNHIDGALNVSCSDRFSKKRLQQGKASLADLVPNKEGRDILMNRLSREIIVYDESTSEPEQIQPSQPLHVVLDSLFKEGRQAAILKGGLKEFKEQHESLCANSLRKVSSAFGGVPVEECETPDIDSEPPSLVLPFMYLGNERDAADIRTLLRLNIGYILNVTSHIPLHHEGFCGIKYKRLPATDSQHQNLLQYFEEAFEFIDEARSSGRNLLIHCQAGVSRSATIAIGYIMKHTRMTMMDAYKFVKNKRTVISPNLNFMGQLVEYETALNIGLTPRVLYPRLRGLETSV
ncbi:dual specificity protein phosphatase 10-like [Branchiostoma lanceolatum]|uniref:Dual specificity protein phosphatase 10 n=1 Tax=Branchiostoma lanceolatum TaxID=7740 RepID=A0A8J9ZUJ9_BRALA|nr:DUSP10 [Branchiostoma lanceolatum]